MIALKIEDLKGFTTKLFVRDTFDGLCVREARVATFSSFSIDGRIRPGYYTKDEREAEGIREYASWRMLRPFCFSLIKGETAAGELSHRVCPGAGGDGGLRGGNRRELEAGDGEGAVPGRPL